MRTSEEIELTRLRTLEQLGVLELLADPPLERIARLAATVTGRANAAVHIFDALHQHRVASVGGAPLDSWPREDTLCRVVVDDDVTVLTGDATTDERFTGSSFVSGDNPIRYYAAAPLRTIESVTIGTVCAWSSDADDDPDESVLAVLADLADMAIDHYEAIRIGRLFAEQALTDPLTGLANRRMLFDRLHELLVDDVAFTVSVIDLDRFKPINDRLGHETGDHVLRAIGDRMREATTPTTLHARIGGDEFVVVDVADPAEADAHLAQLLGRIEAVVETPAGEVSVGASAGSARAQAQERADELLRRADLAMYVVKAERLRSLRATPRPER